MTARLEVLGEDGRWHPVPGVVSVELHEEQLDAPRDEACQRHDVPDDTPRAAVEIHLHVHLAHLQAACARVEAAMRHLAAPRVIDQGGRPVRPAWQSPYGPTPRRH
ncbi:hypothetical protein [Streptomyces sp. PD-S100-1]|uniref:hypothetical protein n=1 Tax=Streptomyces sp. PD-S100-1 TaxID=3394351 RepID=UPI0039BCA66F